jgi:hypothetical protein
MRKCFNRLSPLLVAFAGLYLANGAHAQTVPHYEICSGTLTSVVPGTLHFAGRGLATQFGEYSIKGSNDFDDLGNVRDGEFTTTTADGSTISGVYDGTYTPLSDGTIRFDVHVQWQHGTGRWAGVTGQAAVVAFLQGLAPGDQFIYFTDGTLTFPGHHR